MLLSREEVGRILKATGNLKHLALLTLIYGSGLRVSEAVRLQAEHIDSKKMLVRIDQSKGRKDRYTVLSKQQPGVAPGLLANLSAGEVVVFCG